MEAESVNIISKDGTSLQGIIWNCSNPTAVICLVHGLGEHCERYAHLADFFNTNNISVFTYDQRGHGKSEGKRGHTPNYDILLDDVEELLKTAREAHNDLPIILYGHSFGGNLVANYALRRSTNEIAGVVISSPLLKLAKEPTAAQIKLIKFVSRIFPSLTRPNGLDVNDISTDPEIIKSYAGDPLVHDRISTKMFTEVYNSGYWAIENADRLKVPALVFHGSDDRITAAQGSEEFADKAGDLASFKLWEGMKHETHNDLKKDAVLMFIYEWISHTLNRRAIAHQLV